MPVTTGNNLPHVPYTIPPTSTPEISHLRPKKLAREAKDAVLALGEEMKALDNSPHDLWTGSGEVMVHEKDHHRNFFQRLFGTGEKITAIARFEDGELQKLDAAVYDASHTSNGSQNRNFKYEKLDNGDELFAAPRQVNEWIEREDAGRSKVTSYYREVHHFRVDYTTVRESANGTLTVDLHSDVPTASNLRT